MNIAKIQLPPGVSFQKGFDDDLLLVGNIDSAKYKEIKDSLPAGIRARLLGWRNVGRDSEMSH